MSDPNEIINERDDIYRGAWKKAGLMMEPVADDVANLLKVVPEFFSPWNIMMSKMARILGSPHNKDHWLDIAGYAMLVVHDIEAQNETVSSS